jgi:four helix bundle protein
MRNFKKYNVWTLSHQFTLNIYELTLNFPTNEKYQLISQMQRAAYSIPSNFSEGCGRGSDKEFNRFIQIALGSAHEVEYFLILAKDLKYLNNEDYLDLDKQINEIKQKLYRLSVSLTKEVL